MKIFFVRTCTVLLAICFISCNKEEDPATQPSKTDQITASSWKLNAAGVDQDKNGTIEFSVMALIPTCIIDNTITFKRDNTGVTDEGTSKCNTTDPQTTNFNWNFSDNETYLNITNSVLGQINGKTKILELTDASLSLTKDTTIGGVPVGLVVQLKH